MNAAEVLQGGMILADYPFRRTSAACCTYVTVRVAVPEELAKPPPPEYFPVTVSVPAGAVVAPQAATPPDRTAVHKVVEPVVKVIVPVGVPVPDFGVTTAS